MKRYGKRFLIGWLLSAVGMFGISYVWHGMVLTDYMSISFPITVYLVMASIAYLVIGFLLSRAYIIPYFDRISRHPLLRGPAVGFATGIFVYVVAMAIQTVNHKYGGIVTFNTNLDMKFILMDLTWQGIEQAFGGLVVGFVYMFVFEPMPMMEHDE